MSPSLYQFLRELTLHSVEDLLEGFPRNARSAFRVSSNRSVNLPNLWMLPQCHEEGDSVDGVSFFVSVVDILDQLQLVFCNVDLIGRSEGWQLFKPPLLLSFHQGLELLCLINSLWLLWIQHLL